jgi:hypothetical protein
LFRIAKAELLVLLIFCFWCSASYSAALTETNCVRNYLQGRAFTPEKDAQFIANIAAKIGLQSAVTVVKCDYSEIKATATVFSSADGVSAGDYILYNPTWVQEVTGNDDQQATVLFGHELGHLLNRHLTERKNIPGVEKELEADKVGGCALAKMGGSFSAVTNLFTRLRGEAVSTHPNRTMSLKAAQDGFGECGGDTRSPAVAVVRTPPQPQTCADKMQGYDVPGFRLICDRMTWGVAPVDSPLRQMSFSVSSIQECASKCGPLRGCAGFTFDTKGTGSSKSCYTFGPGGSPQGTGVGWITALK